MNTSFTEVHTGITGHRFGSTDPGQPVRRVIATPFIGTRTRGGNTERGIGVEFITQCGNIHVFQPTDSNNPKEYLRALEILEHMERIDPDVLLACSHAGKKHADRNDVQFRWLKKYQPLQLDKVFAKREIIFKRPCEEILLKTIIAGFHAKGLPVTDLFAKVPEKEELTSAGSFHRMMGIGIGVKSLSLAI